jgi:hypothetical protein
MRSIVIIVNARACCCFNNSSRDGLGGEANKYGIILKFQRAYRFKLLTGWLGRMRTRSDGGEKWHHAINDLGS